MTIEHFWLRIETAMLKSGSCDICPVYRYAKVTNTERMCIKTRDCADGLRMLHKKLQNEERQKMDKERGEDGRE